MSNPKAMQDINLDQGVTLEMVLIPGGSFMMGSPQTDPDRQDDESPLHEVTVPKFWMGRYSITQGQYQAIMGSNPSCFKGDNRPVENVSWYDAMEFCARLSAHTSQTYTLPSEAQWEYACRAGTTTPFHFGETITPDLVNYDGNYTTEVGSFPPNRFGLYDIHGNVFEWCMDRWYDNYHGAPADGSAWVTGGYNRRVLRGGSWGYFPRYCRCAYRDGDNPDNRDDGYGFRVVSVPLRTLVTL